MNVLIERLDVPLDEGWSKFLSPLQRSCLSQATISDSNQEANFLIWGVKIHDRPGP